MATKDSGKRGSRQQGRRGTGQTDANAGASETAREPARAPGASETARAGGAKRRTRGAGAAAPATEPQAPPARRSRKPRPQPAGADMPRTGEPAAAEPPAEDAGAAEAGTVEQPQQPQQPPEPISVMEAPEAAVAGSTQPLAAVLPDESLPPTEMTSEVHGYDMPPVEAPEPEAGILPEAPNAELAEAMRDEQRDAALIGVPAAAAAAEGPRAGRRERTRISHSNALGMLIERHFGDPMSPCRSYSDLERRSGISREALSRYVTSRADRRRSPTIDTLVAIADAMHLSLESVCRAAAASVKGMPLAADEEQHEREEVLSALVVGLTDQQFSAVVELLRHLRPVVSASER